MNQVADRRFHVTDEGKHYECDATQRSCRYDRHYTAKHALTYFQKVRNESGSTEWKQFRTIEELNSTKGFIFRGDPFYTHHTCVRNFDDKAYDGGYWLRALKTEASDWDFYRFNNVMWDNFHESKVKKHAGYSVINTIQALANVFPEKEERDYNNKTFSRYRPFSTFRSHDGASAKEYYDTWRARLLTNYTIEDDTDKIKIPEFRKYAGKKMKLIDAMWGISQHQQREIFGEVVMTRQQYVKLVQLHLSRMAEGMSKEYKASKDFNKLFAGTGYTATPASESMEKYDIDMVISYRGRHVAQASVKCFRALNEESRKAWRAKKNDASKKPDFFMGYLSKERGTSLSIYDYETDSKLDKEAMVDRLNELLADYPERVRNGNI